MHYEEMLIFLKRNTNDLVIQKSRFSKILNEKNLINRLNLQNKVFSQILYC
jgi:hypothetical protein